MDYRGIITEGYHNDAGGQTTIKIISQGYIGTLLVVVKIKIVEFIPKAEHFETKPMKSINYEYLSKAIK